MPPIGPDNATADLVIAPVPAIAGFGAGIPEGSTRSALSFGQRVRAHLSIARLDHSTKNVFVIPGILVALLASRSAVDVNQTVWNVVLALVACTLIACSNYVINELLDAPYDRLHPIKKNRPCALGLVQPRAAVAQWISMMVAGLAVAALVSSYLFWTCAALWIMGCLYNIPPVRTKDLTYVDVLSEAVNNPLRMLVGWYAVTHVVVPPISLLASYWMFGAYFMALKRFSEYREIGDPARATAYRRSFRYYTEQSLLVSVMFYASTGMLFFGAFIARYRLELILAFPFIAMVAAVYMMLSFEQNSPVQHPEDLYKRPEISIPCAICAIVLAVLTFVDLPRLHEVLSPSIFQSNVSGR